jgi:hypothetical protein
MHCAGTESNCKTSSSPSGAAPYADRPRGGFCLVVSRHSISEALSQPYYGVSAAGMVNSNNLNVQYLHTSKRPRRPLSLKARDAHHRCPQPETLVARPDGLLLAAMQQPVAVQDD